MTWLLLFFFFFSSRRRHTRYIGDWSSDVCSSDLRRRSHGADAFFLASQHLEAMFWIREPPSMRPMTREWVARAESDYDGACEALRSRKKSRHERICFFSQQCVEKVPQGPFDPGRRFVSTNP